MKTQYLGDSVYAQIDIFGDLVLTTKNGFIETNEIVLKPEMLKCLEGFLVVCREKRAAVKKELETE